MECLFQPKFKGKQIASFEQAFKAKVNDFNNDMKGFGLLTKRVSEVILERKVHVERYKREAEVMKLGLSEMFKQIKQLVSECETAALAICSEAVEQVLPQVEKTFPNFSELTHALMSPIDASSLDYDTFITKTQEKRAISQQVERLIASDAKAPLKFDPSSITKQLNQLSKSMTALVQELSTKLSHQATVAITPNVASLSSPKNATSSHSHSKSLLPTSGTTASSRQPPTSSRGENTPQMRHKQTPSKCSTSRSRSPMLKTDVCKLF